MAKPHRTKLDFSQPAPAPEPEVALAPRERRERLDRADKKMIGGFFPESVWRELRQLALDTNRTLQSVLEEALTDVLAKYRGRPGR